MGLTGAGWYFSASHYDEIRKELHGHSYEVVCWWPSDPPRDAVALQQALKGTLQDGFDHRTLPPELSTAEKIAEFICRLLDCEAVDVSRPTERLHVRWTK